MPGCNFTFIGFEWLSILHGSSMYYYFGAMVLLSMMVAAGLFYRVAVLLLSILWTAVYLATKTQYNNHYYLMVMLCWLMAVMPAHKRFSLDARLNPDVETNYCYGWQTGLFIFQIACLYVFAAIAKMNNDWLHAIPLSTWFHLKAGKPFIGHFLRSPLLPWIVAYGGLLFDLTVVPGLLYRKTRLFFFILLMGFHLFNGLVFNIGLFPYLAMSLCVFFFPPALYDRFLGNVNRPVLMGKYPPKKIQWISTALAVFVFFQLFLPLRHYLIQGPVSWTEEGYRMSWQMMLRSKRGTAYFIVKDKQTDSTWRVEPSSFVNTASWRHVAVLPDVTWQAAQFLKIKYAALHHDVAVFAHCSVSLNYREYKPLIDTTVDLANEQWNYCNHNKWVLLYKN